MVLLSVALLLLATLAPSEARVVLSNAQHHSIAATIQPFKPFGCFKVPRLPKTNPASRCKQVAAGQKATDPELRVGKAANLMKPEFVQFLVIVLILLGPIAFNHKRNQCGQQAGGISARVARGVVVHKYKACAPRRIVCDGRITAKTFSLSCYSVNVADAAVASGFEDGISPCA